MRTKETVKEFIARSRQNHGKDLNMVGCMNTDGGTDLTIIIDGLKYELVGDADGNIVTLDAIVNGKKINIRDNR